MLLPEPLVRHQGPSTLRATVNEQADEHRWVVHLLHYIPECRSQDVDVIEDVIPLYGVPVSVQAEGPVTGVTLAPQGEALPFEQRAGRVAFVVPEIRGRQMVAIHMG